MEFYESNVDYLEEISKQLKIANQLKAVELKAMLLIASKDGITKEFNDASKGFIQAIDDISKDI